MPGGETLFHETVFKTVITVILDHGFMNFGNSDPITVFSNLKTVIEEHGFKTVINRDRTNPPYLANFTIFTLYLVYICLFVS